MVKIKTNRPSEFGKSRITSFGTLTFDENGHANVDEKVGEALVNASGSLSYVAEPVKTDSEEVSDPVKSSESTEEKKESENEEKSLEDGKEDSESKEKESQEPSLEDQLNELTIPDLHDLIKASNLEDEKKKGLHSKKKEDLIEFIIANQIIK